MLLILKTPALSAVEVAVSPIHIRPNTMKSQSQKSLEIEKQSKKRAIMNWQDFLKHPDVVGAQCDSPGEFLFGLLTHDCLHYLNLIDAAIRLDKDAQILPETIQGVFYNWNVHYIQIWIKKLQELQCELYKPHSAENWEKLIKDAARIPEQLSSIIDEMNKWDFPENYLAQFIIEKALDLLGVCKIIEQGEYLLFWNRTYSPPPYGKYLYRDYLNH